MKNFNITRVYLKIRFLRQGGWGGVTKTPIYREDYLERRAWTVCRFERGLDEKGEPGIWGAGGWYPNVHYYFDWQFLYKKAAPTWYRKRIYSQMSWKIVLILVPLYITIVDSVDSMTFVTFLTQLS